jgi:hypothetical protein
VVIPLSDWADDTDDPSPEEQFSRLLEALREEYKPEGQSEICWVEQIAECIWKQRRVTRSERDLVKAHRQRECKQSATRLSVIDHVANAIFILKDALQETETTGTLSPTTYAAVLAARHLGLTGQLLEPRRVGGEDDTNGTEGKSTPAFIDSLKTAKRQLELMLADLAKEQEAFANHDPDLLLTESEMDKIFRYDRASREKFDWALRNLLGSQQRRRKAQALVAVENQ